MKNKTFMLTIVIIIMSLSTFFDTLTVSASNGNVFSFGFEANEYLNSEDPWHPLGSNTITLDSSVSHNGTRSLLTTNRSAAWHGPSCHLFQYIIPGHSYVFSIWVYQNSGTTQTLQSVIKYIDEDDNISYENIGTVDCPTDTWIELKAESTVRSNTKDSTFYIQSPEIELDFYIDDLNVYDKESYVPDQENTDDISSSEGDSNPLGSDGITESENTEEKVFDFETGISGWIRRGKSSVIVELSEENSHSGKYSLFTSNRKVSYDSPSVNIDSLVNKGTTYNYSLFVMYKDYEDKKYADTQEFLFQLQYSLDGKTRYQTLLQRSVDKGEWTEITGSHILLPKAKNVSLYIQTPENDTELVSFYIDDVKISGEAFPDSKDSGSIVLWIVIPSVVVFLLIMLFLYVKISTKQKEAETIIRTADIDVMTKAFNRNAYERKVNMINKNVNAYQKIRIANCDVNFLKYINDNFGHEDGDEVIIKCSQVLLSVLGSEGGLVYRTGGDEFVCISNMPFEDNLIKAFETEAKRNDADYPFSIAIGFAHFEPSDTDFNDVLKRSDKNMYLNKQKIKSENQQFVRETKIT